MIDREKVIGELEVIKYFFRQCRENFSLGSDVENSLFDLQEAADGAITLLKEQEAVEPTLIREGRNKNYNDYVCPHCDNEVVYDQNYCSECGIPFLWKGR